MKILDRYLFSTIIKSCISVLLGLLLLFSFFQFLEELNEVGTRDYTINHALEYILLLTPSFSNSLVNISLMIGTVYSIGQMNSAKELQILQSATVSKKTIIRKSILIPFVVSIILLIILEIVSPFLSRSADQMKKYSLGKVLDVETGLIWLKRNNNIISFNKSGQDIKELKIFIFDQQSNLENIFTEGEFEFLEKGLNIKNSKIVNFSSKDDFVSIAESKQDFDFIVDFSEEEMTLFNKNEKSKSLVELFYSVISLMKSEMTIREPFLELVTRLIKPFTLIGMLLIAIPFVLNSQRSISVGNRIFIAISVGVITHLFTKITSILSLKYDSLSILGPFLPTLILLFLGLLVLKIKKEELL